VLPLGLSPESIFGPWNSGTPKAQISESRDSGRQPPGNSSFLFVLLFPLCTMTSSIHSDERKLGPLLFNGISFAFLYRYSLIDMDICVSMRVSVCAWLWIHF
jgi:hypothetical protein